MDDLFFVHRVGRGLLRLTGRDRQSFLQGMVTNDVKSLAPGQGCYAFLLDATGHVLADARVLCASEYLLLDVEPGLAAFVAETLDRYLIMERVRIEDVSDATTQVFVGGARAPQVLAEKLGVAPECCLRLLVFGGFLASPSLAGGLLLSWLFLQRRSSSS